MTTLYLTSEADRLGSARDLRRRAGSGEYVRLRRGVYVPTSQWAPLDPDDRYRLLVRAASLVSPPGSQFGRESAAAFWGLPIIGEWPSVVHELVDRGPGGTSRVGIRRHGLGLDPVPVERDGVLVTSLARTLVDVAAALPLALSTPMIDAGMREGISTAALQATLDALLPYPGHARARRAIAFASPHSESPGESFTRVQCHALRLPPPQLQVPFYDSDGFIGFSDFYWPHLDLIGEFDGASKYGDRRLYQRDMTVDEIVLAEKAREDRMRRVATGFVRLRWPVVKDRRALARRLAEHGLVASTP